MPITTKTIINFHSLAGNSVTAEVANNFLTPATGVLNSDLTDTASNLTGVSLTANIITTASLGGNPTAGADTTDQEINEALWFHRVDTLGPLTYVLDFPAAHGAVDIRIYNDADGTWTGQDDMTAEAVGSTTVNQTLVTPGDDIGSDNPTGSFFLLENIAPDGSDQITITLDNNGAGDRYAGINGIVIFPTATGPETISINSGSLALTGSNIGTQPPFVSDTFDGTGALGSHWLIQQSDPVPPPYVVDNVQRQSGYFDGDVTDNTADRTEWFNTLSGLYHYQTVNFPTSGFDEYIIRGVGVGPVANPLNDLVSSGGFAFTGVMCHVDNGFSSLDYEFAVIGHRGGTVATVESKSTLAGTSQVTDEGANVFTGTGVTHGDIRIRLHSDNTIEFAYSDLNADSWTLINSGTGDTPGTGAQKPTFGSTVHIGMIIYAENSLEVPFTGSIDSFELVENKIELTSGSFALTGSNIDTLYNRLMVSESGSFLITGSNIDTLFDRVSVIDSGSFALTGSGIDLLYNRVSPISSGAFNINGSNIDTIYNTFGTTISIDSGSFALTGSVLNTLLNHVDSITGGLFNITGSNIDTSVTLVTDIESGAFILTGSNVQLLYDQITVLESGSFSLTGSNITTRTAGVSESIIDIQLIHLLADKILLKRVRND